jgi:iron complex outermembrane receptor protein
MHRACRAALRVTGAVLFAAGVARSPAAASEDKGEPGAPADDAAAPARLGEEIVVTGSRNPRPLRDAPEAVTVVPRSEIDRSPSKTVDELLRAVPSFGLFRRTSSVVSDPSAQGVNLRGIGPSGVSRSLVLVDGIPANDPFGGWVYWRAISRIGIDRVEVVPGGGSALYGNYALGGVTQVLSRPIAGGAGALAQTECGSFQSCTVAGRAAGAWGRVGAAVDGEYLTSQGYPVVSPASRGPIDSDAPSEHTTLNARVEARAAPDLSVAVRGGFFHEDENGGTRFTTAAVRRFEYAASARYTPGDAGALDVAVFGHKGEFLQRRASIVQRKDPCDQRCDESLSASQDVPAHDLGASVVWTSRSLSLLGAHTLLVGTDVRRITGDTQEDLFPSAAARATSVVRRDAAGEQRLYGAFAQDLYDVSRAVSAAIALRYDRWQNVGARRFEVLGDGSATLTPFGARSDDAFSPKLGVRVRAARWLALRAAAYRAFRAPTLNELYRPFQVGTVRTNANEALGPETLGGGEAGVDVALSPAVTARATGFWNELENPITNVTLGPNLRQRQNLGRARIRGVEADVAWRLGRPWIATASYTLVDSRNTRAPGQPDLVGKELAQDPRHRVSASLAFDDPRVVTAAAQVRYVGRQFEDDQNTLPMAGVFLVDLSVSRRLSQSVELVLAVENLLDAQYLVGRAGVDTIGQPRFVHGGVRLRFGG